MNDQSVPLIHHFPESNKKQHDSDAELPVDLLSQLYTDSLVLQKAPAEPRKLSWQKIVALSRGLGTYKTVAIDSSMG